MQKLRDKLLQVKVSEAEDRLLRRAKELSRLPGVSTFIRQAALEAAEKVLREHKAN